MNQRNLENALQAPIKSVEYFIKRISEFNHCFNFDNFMCNNEKTLLNRICVYGLYTMAQPI